MSWGLASCGAALLTVLAGGTIAAPWEPPEAEGPGPEGRPNHQTATGTMTAYDSGTRVLIVRSAAGSAEFEVAGDARIWMGTQRLPIGRLAAYAGAQVTVAWSEREGRRITHTVRVADTRAARGR
jgi:hypothetical protein